MSWDGDKCRGMGGMGDIQDCFPASVWVIPKRILNVPNPHVIDDLFNETFWVTNVNQSGFH